MSEVKRLVARCRRGEAAAWEELLERYGRLLWSVARSLGAREDEAEEIFQRTWVAVVEGIHELRDPSRLTSWIASTARYQTMRLWSEHRRLRRAVSLDAALGSGLEPEIPPEAGAALEQLEATTALHQALDLLDARCRRLLELLFLADPPADYRQAAAQTGLAVGSIGPIRARCLTRLADLYTGLYHGRPGDDP